MITHTLDNSAFGSEQRWSDDSHEIPSCRPVSHLGHTSNEISAALSRSWVSRIHSGTPSKGSKFSRFTGLADEASAFAETGWDSATTPRDSLGVATSGVSGAPNLSLFFSLRTCQQDLKGRNHWKTWRLMLPLYSIPSSLLDPSFQAKHAERTIELCCLTIQYMVLINLPTYAHELKSHYRHTITLSKSLSMQLLCDTLWYYVSEKIVINENVVWCFVERASKTFAIGASFSGFLPRDQMDGERNAIWCSCRICAMLPISCNVRSFSPCKWYKNMSWSSCSPAVSLLGVYHWNSSVVSHVLCFSFGGLTEIAPSLFITASGSMPLAPSS